LEYCSRTLYYVYIRWDDIIVLAEHPERYGWWLNELDSLGIRTKKINELNDLQEIRNLTQNIKQDFYQDFKTK